MSYLKQLLFIAVLTIFAVAPIAAQQVDDVVRTETSLVQLNVGVVDKQGRPITSLTQKDFVVYEDGVKQAILRQVLRTIHATTVTARSFSNDRFPGRWSFDRTRNETETVTTCNRATG